VRRVLHWVFEARWLSLNAHHGQHFAGEVAFSVVIGQPAASAFGQSAVPAFGQSAALLHLPSSQHMHLPSSQQVHSPSSQHVHLPSSQHLWVHSVVPVASAAATQLVPPQTDASSAVPVTCVSAWACVSSLHPASKPAATTSVARSEKRTADEIILSYLSSDACQMLQSA